eukprot:5285057-Prymnesium_polylepis.1
MVSCVQIALASAVVIGKRFSVYRVRSDHQRCSAFRFSGAVSCSAVTKKAMPPTPPASKHVNRFAS